MLIEDEKVELLSNLNIPHRQRWMFLGYVSTRVQSKEGKRVSLLQAIREFTDAFGIEDANTDTLKTEYYRLCKLHKTCLKNGI